jgi:predicted metal-dependent hydrolase
MIPEWPYPTEVVRSKNRRKTVSIQVVGGRVRVLCPKETSDAYIARLLEARRDWIENAFARQAQSRSTDAELIRRQFWLLGNPLSVKHVEAATSSDWNVRLQGDVLYIHAPKRQLSEESLRRAIISWYRQVAESDFSSRLERWSKQMGVAYRGFRVKDQKTRWGSCSSRGNINLNWRLIQAPDCAIDYVVVHELCHLREMNHSERFWSLVEAALPTYQQGRDWLRNHGNDLFF